MLCTERLTFGIAATLIGATFALPSAAAPDEARYGAAQGYPIGNRNDWYRTEHLVGAFTSAGK